MKTIVAFFIMVVLSGNILANDPDKNQVLKPSIENLDEAMTHLIYPVQARENGIEGFVTVRFTVDENGKLVKYKVKSACDPLLKEAVMEIVDELKFSPAKVNDKAVAGALTVPFTFRLDID